MYAYSSSGIRVVHSNSYIPYCNMCKVKRTANLRLSTALKPRP